MPLHSEIKQQIKAAMLARDSVRLGVLRGLSAAFTNELVAKGRKPQEEATDEEALVVIRRLVNQRKDSIEQFKKGAREDLAATEAAELAVLETYMPKMMSRAEIRIIAEKKKTELGVTDKSKAGALTGAIMKELKGKADGADVKAVVDELFS